MEIGQMEVFLLVATLLTALFIGTYIAWVNKGYEEREQGRRAEHDTPPDSSPT